MSLPIPASEYIPKLYQDDPLFSVLAAKMDSSIATMCDDIAGLETLHQPERCPSGLLEEFGYWLAAGILSADGDRTKREKIATAVDGHKKRGSWTDDAKPKVDAIAGGDSSIVAGFRDAWWVLSSGDDPTNYYWSAFGFESEHAFDGIILTGIGDEGVFPGNIRIDVDNSGLSAAQITQMKLSLADVAPAYMRLILGYVSGGDFIEYANGRIE